MDLIAFPPTGYISPDTKVPEPHGITGIDRSDDPLMRLDEASLHMRARFITMMKVALLGTLGGTTPGAQALFQRMNNPCPADLVVESTRALYQAEHDPLAGPVIEGFGYLITARPEWATTRAEWEQLVADGVCSPDERLAEMFHFIQYGPAPEDVARWSNCLLVSAITDMREFGV